MPDPDFVAISFSSLDFVGHDAADRKHPNSTRPFKSWIAMSASCCARWTRRSAATNYAVAFTADHGVALVPEKQQARGIDAGAISTLGFRAAVDAAVSAKLGIRGPIVVRDGTPGALSQLPERGVAEACRARRSDRAVVEAAQAQPGMRARSPWRTWRGPRVPAIRSSRPWPTDTMPNEAATCTSWSSRTTSSGAAAARRTARHAITTRTCRSFSWGSA